MIFKNKRGRQLRCFADGDAPTPGGDPNPNPAGPPGGGGDPAPAPAPNTAPAPNPNPAPVADKEVEIKYSTDTAMEDILKQFPEYAQEATINKYRTMNEFLKGHKELNSKMGTMISLPKEDATDEEKTVALDKIYQKLGKPETADKYELSKEVPEGLALNEGLQNNFKTLAHKINLTATQAQELQDFHNKSLQGFLAENSANQAVAAETHLETQIGELKSVWGADYKDRTQIAVNTTKALLSQDTRDYLDKTGLGNNAKFIQDMYNISKKFSGEGPPKGPDGGGGDGVSELMTLEAEAMELRRDKTLSDSPLKLARLKIISARRAELVYPKKP